MFVNRDDHDSPAGQSGQVSTISRTVSVQSNSTRGDDSLSIEEAEPAVLEQYPTHHSLGPDTPVEPQESTVEIPDEVYDRLPSHRKIIIVALLSYCALLAPISSTSVLAATPEVAATYNTDGTIIGLSNALYMLFMGVSPMFWGPLSQERRQWLTVMFVIVYGRRWVTIVTSTTFLACSVGTALAPNLAAFFIFRILTAFEGTSFILVGSAVIGDMYRSVERGTALGWFLSGTLTGPAFGPFIGGILVTYANWRAIFWLQTGLAGVAALGSYFLLPETIYHKKLDDLVGYSGLEKNKVLLGMINPLRVIRLYRYPNLFLAGLASASLLWNMYSLLTPIRYILNPRFNLSTPMQGGLFYLAPGAGYLMGTFVGGRYADYVVKKYIKKRGIRIPEDRLYSALPFMGIVIPSCMLIYGWTIEKAVGGIPLAVIVMFFQGLAQLFSFPSLNTYCLDVMPTRSGEVVASNYVIRYLFACAGTVAVLPAVQVIGIGWFSTISAIFLVLCSLGTLATIKWGKTWRERVDGEMRAKRLRERERQKQKLQDSCGDGAVDTSDNGANRSVMTTPETRQMKEGV